MHGERLSTSLRSLSTSLRLQHPVGSRHSVCIDKSRMDPPVLDPTLGLVLQMVPQLRHSCTMLAQNGSGDENCGVKTLRRVSKHCKEVMDTEVHGFCLHLRSLFILSLRPNTSLQSLTAWEFLHGKQLHRLAIQIQGEEPVVTGMQYRSCWHKVSNIDSTLKSKSCCSHDTQ